MSFTGFQKTDFDTFLIDGLDARMEAIQTRIQPKFQKLGSELTEELSLKLGNEMYLHIAKHARRTVNPPKDTWLAICDNKRGYKKHPHFQVGLFDDHLFIWLALIYELPNKQNIAKAFLESFEEIKELPDDFVVSLDHMKKDSISLADLNEEHLHRFHNVKKAEFLIGKHYEMNDPIIKDGDRLFEVIKAAYESLIPLYKLAKANS
ncbi:YktB family protein [Oceanobacillus sp. FSL H7-0719]|uniref:YktB family protein n=1 Tax=Oceanobacillus sp. FSL H7-0719 TaxID=2954507 RepID=UPI0032493BBB